MIRANLTNTFKTDIYAREHHFIVDEPTKLGGENLGPTPMEFLEASLASCTTITLKMYLNRKDWDVQEITVDTHINKNEKYEYQSIDKSIEIKGKIDPQQLDRLLIISKKCPVHKFMEKSITINSKISLK